MLQITAVGRLTRDSNLNFTADGKPVLAFSVATDVGWGDNKHPVYLGCSYWRNPESLHPYLKKGTQVVIVGEGDLRLWEKAEKHGAEITVNVSTVKMVGSKQDSAAPEAPKASGFRKAPAMATKPADDFADDDIPF